MLSSTNTVSNSGADAWVRYTVMGWNIPWTSTRVRARNQVVGYHFAYGRKMTGAERITRKIKGFLEQGQLKRAVKRRPEVQILIERHEALAQTVEILTAMQRSNEQLLQEILRQLGALEDDE